MPTARTAVAAGLASTPHSRPRVILCQSEAIAVSDAHLRSHKLPN